jgi:putative hydrolase of the HAD superfamily
VAEVNTLLFDLGGVLLTNGWDRASRRKAVDRFHLDWEEFEDRHELVLHGFEIGQVTLSEYLQRTVFYRDRSFSREEFKEFIFEQSQPLPGSLEFLAELAAPRRLLMASLNNESLELNEYRISRFGLKNYFSAFFSSCYLGVRKPDAGIYQLAIRITQRAPQECVFIDDRGLNLECARDLGMHVIQFRSPAQLREDLAKQGVLPNAG